MNKTRLFDYLTEKVKSQPNSPFLCSKVYENNTSTWKSYTYTESEHIAKQFASALFEKGIKKGDTIGVAAPNRPEWNFVDLGCQYIGAVLVPLYPTASEKDFQYILNDAEVKYMFVSDKDLHRKVSNVKNQIPSLIETYTFDKIDGVPHWTEMLAETIAKREIEYADSAIQEHDLATIIYTSGTTGNPKGVMLSHKNMVANLRSTEAILPFLNGKKALSFLPLCHCFERIVFFAYLSQGIYIHYAESLETIGENLKEVKPFCFTTVPRLLEKVYEKIMEKGNALSGFKRKLFFWSIDLGLKYELNKPNGILYDMQLAIARKLVFSKWQEALGGEVKFIVTGAAPFQARLFRLFSAADIAVVEGYGMTEASPGIAINRYEPEGRRMGTVGEPLPGVEVKLAADGEILAKGDNVMMGYYKQPELTADMIDKDGWLHTGDIGEFVEGKFLKITDRKKELFKTSGGKYVAPQPIENKLKESKFIEQAMLVGDNEKYVSALIVPSFLALETWAKDNDLNLGTNEEMIANPKVVSLIQSEIDRFNEELGQVDKVKKIKLLAKEWSIEEGELTPTLKVKRKAILTRYENLVKAMYAE